MFGFLSPRPHSDHYRHAYARVCVHLRRAFGLRALPFHSYEAVFLYQLALDAGAFSSAVMPAVRCCKLASPGNLSGAADAMHGRFSAAVALLLAEIKLTDDIHDSGSWLARGVRFVLKGRLRAARRHLGTLDPAFDDTVNGFLATHAKLEARTDAIPLAEYVEPTSQAFGYVFGLAARLPGMGHAAEPLTAIGRGVGSALLAFDCAVDWQKDRKRGEFNPLPDEAAVRAAMRFSVNELDDVAERCRRAFGSRSSGARTATAVADRLATRNPLAVVACPTVPAWKRALAFLTAKPAPAMAGPMLMATRTEDEPADGGADKPWRRRKDGDDGEEKPADEKPDAGKPDGSKSSANRDDTCCGATCCAAEVFGNCGECCCALAACG